MLLCTVVVQYVLAQSFLFGHIKSYFLKNEFPLPSFQGHKNGPTDHTPLIFNKKEKVAFSVLVNHKLL